MHRKTFYYPVVKLSRDGFPRFMELIQLFTRVFETDEFEDPGRSYLENLLQQNDFHVFVAIHDNKVIGGLTVYTLPQYLSVKPLALIYDLAVDPSFQRQGVGGQLMAETNQYFRRAGYAEVFVQADEADLHAIEFYRSVSPSGEEPVRQFSFLF